MRFERQRRQSTRAFSAGRAAVERGARPWHDASQQARPAAIARWRATTLCLVVAAIGGCAGSAPANLGVDGDGMLSPCPASPNCVSSDARDDDHTIAPLMLSAEPDQSWQELIALLASQPGVTVLTKDDGYLRAEARTPLLRFVDDVEFHLRAGRGEIAMRSASRVGYSDLGTNRRRLEAIRDGLALAGVVAPSDQAGDRD